VCARAFAFTRNPGFFIIQFLANNMKYTATTTTTIIMLDMTFGQVGPCPSSQHGNGKPEQMG